jgi:proteasome lid subunit RPN8/RPN11
MADIKLIHIPNNILLAMYLEARKVFPDECCGWLEGSATALKTTIIRPCTNSQEKGNHPTESQRSAETAYVIDGKDLLEFNAKLDLENRPLLIYHSHPNGRAYLSETDRTVATSPWGDGPAYPVQQLVIGINDEEIVESVLFAWSDTENGFIEIKRFVGSSI